MAEESKAIVRPSTRNRQRVLWKEVDDVNEKEQLVAEINTYASLQRIKAAPDRDKELEYQLLVSKAKLEAMGIDAEKLDINR